MEYFWRWQPSEAKRLTWSEVMNYVHHANLLQATMKKKHG